MNRDRVRVRAPELRGAGGWFNTAEPLTLARLRGRVVLLDFWTAGCVNCLHVLDELRPLADRYGDQLIIIGVHSPKFAHETEHDAVATAVERNGITHPVLDDSDLSLWSQYAVKAWPTLTVIDRSGYVVAQYAGEGHAGQIDTLVAELLRPSAPDTAPDVAPDVAPTAGPSATSVRALSFPAKALLLPAARTGRTEDSVLVADAGGHDLVELATDLVTVLRRIGTGRRGRRDGSDASDGSDARDGPHASEVSESSEGSEASERSQAEFAEPSGLALLPPELAGELGYDVVVADTGNHLLRAVRLRDGQVSRLADLRGRGLRTITGVVPDVMSPWDVAWWPALDRLVIAAAGVHLLLSLDLRTGTLDRLAGTTVEGLRDGPALDGWLAQPSGLAVAGDRLWFVDAETSALRWLDARGTLHTAVGEGLFDFGQVDGPARQARLQHPLGVTVLPNYTVAIMDTYNGAVRLYDPVRASVSTLVDGLAEPSGAILDRSGELIVVESAAHRLTPVLAATRHAPGTAAKTVYELAPGPVSVRVSFTPPAGQIVDERFGPATRLNISATPDEAVLAGTGRSTQLTRELVLAADVVLNVEAQAASCDHHEDQDDPTANPNPACYVSRQQWQVAVRINPDGAHVLELVLSPALAISASAQ